MARLSRHTQKVGRVWSAPTRHGPFQSWAAPGKGAPVGTPAPPSQAVHAPTARYGTPSLPSQAVTPRTMPQPPRQTAQARHQPPATMERMIDWKLAGTVANGVAGLQSAGDPAPFEDP